MRRVKLGQQEMVGFVLIVVLVIIALMVFLAISLRKAPEARQSVEVENMLSAIMRHTTDCAVGYKPNYASIEKLIQLLDTPGECVDNLIEYEDYLNESVFNVSTSIMGIENTISFYNLSISSETSSDVKSWEFGVCAGGRTEARHKIIRFDPAETFDVRLVVCRQIS